MSDAYPATITKPFSWRFTTPLFFGSALNPINSALIATALVPIADGVHVPVGQTAALVSALYVATAIAQPTAGKAAEVFGPRRVFLIGIVLVLVGGIVGGFAPNLALLIASRVILGLGTSCAYPTAMLLIRRRAQEAGLEQPPGGVIGGLQIAGVATASLGLPIGGILVQLFGWRSVFYVNVPVAIIALVLALLWVPKDTLGVGRRNLRGVLASLDTIGIIGFAAAMTSLLLFLSSLPNPTWLYLAGSVVCWAALTAWEMHSTTPLLDVRMLATHRAMTRTYLRFAIVMLCSYVVLYGITQWLEAVRGLSEFSAGLLLLPMTLVSGLVVIPVSRRNLIRSPLLVAAVACVAAGIAVLFLHTAAWFVLTLVITIVLGIAQGAGVSSNTTALYTQTRAEQLGTASGLLRSFGYLGSIASSAIIGIVFHHDVSNAGITTIGWIMLAVSLFLLSITAFDRTLRRSATH